MSEAAGAGGASSSTAGSGAQAAGTQANAQAQGKSGAQVSGGTSAGSKGPAQPGGQARGAAPAASEKANHEKGGPSGAGSPAPEAEELEEIKVGSASHKVPKSLAKQIKDLERGFQGKAQEAAMGKKQFETFVSQAKANPEWFFQQTGIDPDQFSQARLADKLKREMMTPEQRRAMEQEQELNRYRGQEKERQAREAKEKEEREYQETSSRIRKEALSSIGKSEEIRDDPYLVSRVFAIKGASEEQGLDWDWDKCVNYVETEQRTSWAKRHSSLTPQQLEERLGGEVLSKWREHDLKRVTEKSASAGSASSPHGRQADPASSPQKKSLSESEWRDYWKRLQG